MGVSTTGESGETFPTRILTLEIYWGISPGKIRFRPDISPVKILFRPDIDPLTFECSMFDFLYTKFGHSRKIVSQIRRLFSFW